MTDKRWRVKEFTRGTSMGIGQFRETAALQILDFLNSENLTPNQCCISWHTEPDGQNNDKTLLIAQVYYYK
ncbi:MAG TPA: hypothetical protein VJK04_01450 [Candidatus Paceibacterota bacterium]